jgi:DNA-binding PadR family transcriptional regulator
MTLNSTSAVVLGVLHDGPATGGAIVAAASRRLAAQGGVTRSQVYRELPVLAAAGFIRAGKEGARSSQPYAITASGRRAFQVWATSGDGGDSVRSSAVLRLGFGAHLTAEQRSQIIALARDEHRLALAQYRNAVAELQASGDLFGTATAQFAVAYERAMLRWLDSVPADVDAVRLDCSASLDSSGSLGRPTA